MGDGTQHHHLRRGHGPLQLCQQVPKPRQVARFAVLPPSGMQQHDTRAVLLNPTENMGIDFLAVSLRGLYAGNGWAAGRGQLRHRCRLQPEPVSQGGGVGVSPHQHGFRGRPGG
ncbi:unannotated protein [freshwater metagenome]|uniref:Unannotated protein n=1 Tax=freshwater metagenome TaxID=449393 RepID=A0A6J6D3G2_9ZZZZ